MAIHVSSFGSMDKSPDCNVIIERDKKGVKQVKSDKKVGSTMIYGM